MRLRNYLFLMLSFFCILSVQAQQSGGTTTSFAVANLGGSSITTSGAAAATGVGYAVIHPTTGNTTPPGVAIFGFRQNGILVSEAGVPASLPSLSGRIYAEVNGPVNTGIAIANPNSQTATINFSFTDQDGTQVKSGSTTIVAGGQTAKFLDQAPFSSGPSFSGTLTFNSDIPVAVVALRGLTNERSEFLMTTLPVTSLTAPSSGPAYLPQFADGGGWSTQVVLVNPSDDVMSGVVQFFGQGNPTTAGQPASVTIDGQTAATFNYTIPARSSRRLQTAGADGNVVVGSARIVPAGTQNTPSGLAIFSFRNAGVTVTEAGVAASHTGQAFRMYAETSDASAGSIQTGLAIANPASNTVQVSFDLYTLLGVSTGLHGSVNVPPSGQVSLFLNQIPGFESLQAPFQGLLHLATISPAGVAVVGLRGRYNERSDFLITTTPPLNEIAAPSSLDLVFPHLADGGGYTTQFILFSGSINQSTSGALKFLNQEGSPISLTVSGGLPNSPAPVITSVSPASPTVSANPQVITVIGTNFQTPGFGVTLVPPQYGGNTQALGQQQLQAVTATSFQMTISLAQLGSYSIQVQNPSGSTSDAFNFMTRFRTSDATWIPEGVLLTDATTGPGGGIADVMAFQLSDGRWRMIFNAFQSAISQDGLAWTLEKPAHGLPKTDLDGNSIQPHLPRVFKLDNGDLRSYFGCGCSTQANGMYSAISHDEGVTWTMEPGVRFLLSDTTQTGFLSGLSVVKIGPSRWRGYFSGQSDQLFPGTEFPTMSATSSDLLTWTVESGNRIGSGSTLSGTALHVKAIANSDGSVTTYYWRLGGGQTAGASALMYTSTSTDGLSFTNETLIESLGNAADPDVVQVGNGLRIYYNWGGSQGGAIYSAVSTTGARASLK